MRETLLQQHDDLANLNLPEIFQQQNAFQSASISVERPLVGEGKITIAGKVNPVSFIMEQPVDGVSRVTINAPTLGGEVSLNISEGDAPAFLSRRRAAAVAAATVGTAATAAVVGTPQTASAALELTGVPDSSYQSMGLQEMDYGQRWIYATLPDGTHTYFSGTEVQPGWVVTAAHPIVEAAGTYTVQLVGTGSNFLTDPGQESTVQGTYIYPGYSGGFESPDIALIHLTTSLTDQTLSIAPFPSANDVLTLGGYGSYATIGQTTPVQDGTIRGFTALADGVTPSNVSATYFVDSQFSPYTGLDLNGKALGGDSGGGTFNSQWQYVGPIDAYYGGTGAIGGTDSEVLSQSQVHNWEQTTINSVPEPTTFGILGLVAIGVFLSRSKRN